MKISALWDCIRKLQFAVGVRLEEHTKTDKGFRLGLLLMICMNIKEPPTALGRLRECNTQTVIATKLRDLIGNENPCQLCLPCVSLWTKVRVGIALPEGSPHFDICQVVACAMGLIGNSQ